MKKILLALCLLPYLTNAQFSELAPMPEPVANNAVVAAEVGGQPYVYSFAGIDTTKIWSGLHLKSWRYDVTNDEWSTLPDVPDPNGGKIAAWASEVKGKIYVIGGYHVAQNGSEVSSVKTHVFDPESNEWLPDAADVPVPIDDQVQAVWRDSLIFVVTGWSNAGNVTDVQIFNPSENEWMVGTPVPNQTKFKVFGGSGVIIEDTIYYAGGARFAFNFPATTHFRKGVINPDNPTEIEWEGADADEAQGYRMAAVAAGGKAYWLGGSDVTYNYNGIAYNGSGGVPPLNRITVYDPGSDVFYQKTDCMPAVMDLRGQGQISDNQLIIAGGMEEGQKVSDRTWLIDIGNVTGVKQESLDFDFDVFPNPSADFFSIKVSGDFRANVYGSSGKIWRQATANEFLKIETHDWPNGVYWLEVILPSGARSTQGIMVD